MRSWLDVVSVVVSVAVVVGSENEMPPA